jgi:hypothetical protein
MFKEDAFKKDVENVKQEFIHHETIKQNHTN